MNFPAKIDALWKFHDFCIIQILRENNLEEALSRKSAILPHLEALNFDFYNFLHFSKCGIDQINKIQSPKMAKMADLELQ